MTIVCCWLDESYGRRRLTAIADARACVQDDKGEWHPLTETTVKLLRAKVQCHTMDAFRTDVATWADPYYQTEIGIGFAGYCFEALSIITLFSRCLEQLVVVDNEEQPKPEPKKIVNLAGEIMNRYFDVHSNRNTQTVELLIFGFSPDDGEPWVAKVAHKGGEPTKIAQFEQPVEAKDFFAIGDVARNRAFLDSVHDLRKHIAKHASELRQGKGERGQFKHELETANHKSAEKKIIEELTLGLLDDEFSRTVGGVLQKIEVYQDGSTAVVSFSRDDRHHILDALPSVGTPHLIYVPIGEKMGHRTKSV